LTAVNAIRELSHLREEIEQARAELAQLHQAARATERRLGKQKAATLLEVTEQLVVAAVRAQTQAEAATEALEQISRLTEVDALTDLPNRAALLNRFNYAIAIARRTGTQLALLFVDLNNFKQINDTLGHGVGDQVLRLAAQRLASAVRGSDTVSRHGGDEFLILLTDLSQAADVVRIAVKLIAALGPPTRVGEHVLRLTASIGISLFPDDGEDAHTLIQRADAAMYRAKRSGLGGFAFHGPHPSGPLRREPRVLSALHYPLTQYRAALADQARRHAQLRDANEQLVLAALGAQKLQDAAEQAQRRQGDFLAVLAHELRNSLGPTRIAASLLQQARLDRSLLPRIQTMIEQQVTHMSRMVGDLLDVSRVSSGKFRLERRMVDLNSIIEEGVAASRPAMDARLQHFTVQVPAGLLEFYGDPIRLAQILSNLLDNASKYTKEGGDIGISVMASADSMVITVADSGIGMSAECLPTVFEPFAQDINAIEFSGAGLGIGLTVVRELVEAHSGTIVASSAGIGLGSQFVVTLPRTDGTTASVEVKS
jgi:diguanylate cyclase (GGDEF)-like protein